MARKKKEVQPEEQKTEQPKKVAKVSSNKYKKIVPNPLAIHGAIIRDEYFEMPEGNSEEFIDNMIENKLIEKA